MFFTRLPKSLRDSYGARCRTGRELFAKWYCEGYVIGKLKLRRSWTRCNLLVNIDNQVVRDIYVVVALVYDRTDLVANSIQLLVILRGLHIVTVGKKAWKAIAHSTVCYWFPVVWGCVRWHILREGSEFDSLYRIYKAARSSWDRSVLLGLSFVTSDQQNKQSFFHRIKKKNSFSMLTSLPLLLSCVSATAIPLARRDDIDDPFNQFPDGNSSPFGPDFSNAISNSIDNTIDIPYFNGTQILTDI